MRVATYLVYRATTRPRDKGQTISNTLMVYCSTADENMKDIYKVNNLTGMKRIRGIWKEVPASVIMKYWNHTSLVKQIGPAVAEVVS